MAQQGSDVLPDGPKTGTALVKERLIDMISFTGSTRVGRQVGSIASERLKRVSLELGGNNPYIVLDDADIVAAASAGAWAAFFHQGQICLTGGRHIVHERIADAYVKALVRKAKALAVGDPFDEKVSYSPGFQPSRRPRRPTGQTDRSSQRSTSTIPTSTSREPARLMPGIFHLTDQTDTQLTHISSFDFLDMVFGPIITKLIVQNEPIRESFAISVFDHVVNSTKSLGR